MVVCPRRAPSLTDQSRGSPSQPVRSLPLASAFMPAGSGGAELSAPRAERVRQRQTTTADMIRLINDRDSRFNAGAGKLVVVLTRFSSIVGAIILPPRARVKPEIPALRQRRSLRRMPRKRKWGGPEVGPITKSLTQGCFLKTLRGSREGALLRRSRTRSPFPASARVWLPPGCHKARRGRGNSAFSCAFCAFSRLTSLPPEVCS